MLDLSGERHGPSVSQPVDAEHWHRYLFALQLAQEKKVLDIASGEGYGSALLASMALAVTGVDASEEAVQHASSKYRKENLKFVKGSLEKIPLKSGSVDLVTCFETIEHTSLHREAFTELGRVLTEEGILLLSTPDKTEYSTKRNYANPFHVRELERTELMELLRDFFPFVKLYGQRFYAASIIHEWQANESNGIMPEVQRLLENKQVQENMNNEPMYWIAAASKQPLPHLKGGLLDILDAWQQHMVAAQTEIYQSKSYRLGNFFVRAVNRLRSK